MGRISVSEEPFHLQEFRDTGADHLISKSLETQVLIMKNKTQKKGAAAAAADRAAERAREAQHKHPYIPPRRYRADKLTFIALARTYNVRVSTDTVREQHV